MTSRTSALRDFGQLLAHDAGGDEERGFDGAGVIAQRIEDAVGGDDTRGLADERGARAAKRLGELLQVELRIEARNGFELVESAAGVAEGPAADHGDADAGNAGVGWMRKAGGGENRGDEQRGLVADAAGGVLVDGEGIREARHRRYRRRSAWRR